MKCPRCGLPMVNGKIPTDRYRVVFRGDKNDPRTKFAPFEVGLMGPKIPLSGFGMLLKNNCYAYYCSACNMVVIPGPGGINGKA